MKKNFKALGFMSFALLTMSAYAAPSTPILTCQDLVNTCWSSVTPNSPLKRVGYHIGGRSTVQFNLAGGSGGDVNTTCAATPKGLNVSFNANHANYPSFVVAINSNLYLPNDKELLASGYLQSMQESANVSTKLIRDPNLSDCDGDVKQK